MIIRILSWFRPKRETPIRRTGPIARVEVYHRNHITPLVLQDVDPGVFRLFLGSAANGDGGEAA